MRYPGTRPQRLRSSPAWRRLVRETSLRPTDLIWPLFVTEGEGVEAPVPSMPGVHQLSVDRLEAHVQDAESLGVGGVLLFGVTGTKDAEGSRAWDPDGPVPRAIRAIKGSTGLLVWRTSASANTRTTDTAGSLRRAWWTGTGAFLLLARAATCYADAGADAVAPSDMFDGRVAALRQALDDSGALDDPRGVLRRKVCVEPVRPVPGTRPVPAWWKGTGGSHQMDPANSREALLEAALDQAEGADVLMVKPASYYLDVIADVYRHCQRPVAAYQVSGEYAMIHAAAREGWLDARAVAMESLTAIRRAGAQMIVTYFAPEAARWLRDGSVGYLSSSSGPLRGRTQQPALCGGKDRHPRRSETVPSGHSDRLAVLLDSSNRGRAVESRMPTGTSSSTSSDRGGRSFWATGILQ